MSDLCVSYKDFLVRFEHWSEDDGSYQVLVETDNRKKTTAIFFPPKPQAGEEQHDSSLVSGTEENAESLSRNIQIPKSANLQENVGEDLYIRLFQKQVGEFLAEGLALAQKDGFGLRLKLCADLKIPGMASVVNLPWELLNRYGEELGLSVCTPIVRYLDTSKSFTPPVLEDRLRILIAMSNPRLPNLAPLNLEAEYERIAELFEGSSLVEVEKLSPVNSDALLDRLSDSARPVHVLHFMGHGVFQNGEGQLVFEEGDGTPEFINGKTLVRFILQDADAMQLIFLNACNTAVQADASSTDAFAGVASAIIKTGMPAVVAMQKPVKDIAAIAFADTFYTKLAEGSSIERALTEGRKKIGLAYKTGFEWAIPVLFMHAPDGVLFPSLQGNDQATPTPEADAAAEEQPSVAPAESPTKTESTMRKLVYLICDRNDLKAIRPLYKYLGRHNVDIEIPAFDGASAREIAEANQKLLAACDLVLHYYGAGDAAWKKSIASELIAIPALESRTRPPPKIYTVVASPASDDKDLLLMKDSPYLIDATHVEAETLLQADIDTLKPVFDPLMAAFMQDVNAE